jgi:broad specificity phosphatase PhoE
MSTVTVIRHSNANYPFDELTNEGVEFAGSNRERFSGYSKVICSPLNRSQQTATALGYESLIIDDRVTEFEININAESADDYIREVHVNFASDLVEYGNKLLEAIRYYGQEDCLIVSHNAVMSAAFYLLVGDNSPFQNLDGFQVQVDALDIKNPKRIKLE